MCSTILRSLLDILIKEKYTLKQIIYHQMEASNGGLLVGANHDKRSKI